MLHQLDDDDELAAEVGEELAECPCGAELLEVESKLRGKLHYACAEHAPENLRLRLLSYIHCSNSELPADGEELNS